MTNRIQIQFQIIRDASKIFRTNPEATLQQVLPHFVEAAGVTIGGNPGEAIVLVAKQVLSQDVKLRDLKLRDGDYLLVYFPERENPKLILHHPSESPSEGWNVLTNQALIGRGSEGIAPEVDLNDASEKLRESTLYVSGQQAVLVQEDGTWYVRLHQKGRSVMFVDRQLLDQGEKIALRDGSVLSFGKSVDNPKFQLICRIAPK